MLSQPCGARRLPIELYVMLALTRLPEFNRAYHSADLTWSPEDAAASLQFTQGLLFSFVLVTPFWVMVGLVLHALTR